MNILHISELVTMRPIKLILAQQALGYTCQLIFNRCGHEDMLGDIIHQSMYHSEPQLADKVKAFTASGYDTIHVYTRLKRQKYVQTIREIAGPDVRIIWDVHDLIKPQEEMQYAKYADALTVPSQGFKRKCGKFIKRPITVIYGMVPRQLFPISSQANMHRIHATCLCSGVGVDPVWRDYREVQALLNQPLFIFAGSPDYQLLNYYDNLMMVHPYEALLHQMPAFEWGYAGAANSQHNINICFTNKCWEYIACGLPVITYNATEMAEWIGANWVGRNLQNLDDRIITHNIKRNVLWQSRHKWSMESQADKFTEIYKK